jgi:hypothetical protein
MAATAIVGSARTWPRHLDAQRARASRIDPAYALRVVHATIAESYHTVYAVADLDGDGIDEVVTEKGIIRWDGKQWTLPPYGRPPAGC